jgi:hypothetical protein
MWFDRYFLNYGEKLSINLFMGLGQISLCMEKVKAAARIFKVS